MSQSLANCQALHPDAQTLAALGVPYLIGEVVIDRIKSEDRLCQHTLLLNPVTAKDIKDGSKFIVYSDGEDAPSDQSGNAAMRNFSFKVGVIVRDDPPEARKTVHQDYKLIKGLLRKIVTDLGLAKIVNVNGQLREGSVSYHLEGIDVGGAMLIANFSLSYRENHHPSTS